MIVGEELLGREFALKGPEAEKVFISVLIILLVKTNHRFHRTQGITVEKWIPQ